MNVKKLEKIVVGFIDNSRIEDAKKFLQTEVTKTCRSRVLDAKGAKEFFNPEAENEGITSHLRKLMQKHIGGGMSEFLRDLISMKTNESLIIIDVEGCATEELEAIKRSVKRFGFQKAKHLGLFAVEHLTVEDGHDEEMRFLKSIGF